MRKSALTIQLIENHPVEDNSTMECSPARSLPTGSRLPPCREQIKWVKDSDGIPVVLVGTSVTWSWYRRVSAGQNLTQNCSVPCSDVLAQMHQGSCSTSGSS
ncbi:hypothetical protein E5288_WYG002532 [Bos mutus]|uniref:Uncharacterized protein n=1 Tax=Bos mutus TaxID=72004 RepID=A0A6B0R3X1_9CETA|nr:hypothetical protein [Bos mutus]